MEALRWYDYILLVVSLLMILIVVLQSSKEDGMSAFTGEKSELFANQKQRGLEKVINIATTVLSIAAAPLTAILSPPKELIISLNNIIKCY